MVVCLEGEWVGVIETGLELGHLFSLLFWFPLFGAVHTHAARDVKRRTRYRLLHRKYSFCYPFYLFFILLRASPVSPRPVQLRCAASLACDYVLYK